MLLLVFALPGNWTEMTIKDYLITIVDYFIVSNLLLLSQIARILQLMVKLVNAPSAYYDQNEQF